MLFKENKTKINEFISMNLRCTLQTTLTNYTK